MLGRETLAESADISTVSPRSSFFPPHTLYRKREREREREVVLLLLLLLLFLVGLVVQCSGCQRYTLVTERGKRVYRLTFSIQTHCIYIEIDRNSTVFLLRCIHKVVQYSGCELISQRYSLVTERRERVYALLIQTHCTVS